MTSAAAEAGMPMHMLKLSKQSMPVAGAGRRPHPQACKAVGPLLDRSEWLCSSAVLSWIPFHVRPPSKLEGCLPCIDVNAMLTSYCRRHKSSVHWQSTASSLSNIHVCILKKGSYCTSVNRSTPRSPATANPIQHPRPPARAARSARAAACTKFRRL